MNIMSQKTQTPNKKFKIGICVCGFMLKHAISIYIDESLSELFRRTVWYMYRMTIRQYLPVNGHYVYNDVDVIQKHVLDRVFFPYYSNEPTWEGGVVSCHEAETEIGDSIIIVGGGKGISAVRAARIAGKSGNVILYEGGKESVEYLDNVIEINDVVQQVTVRHAIVGHEINVFGGDSSMAKSISPDELPDCDVLELDCEGSEIDILYNMDISPRVIIMEIHPWQFSDDFDVIMKYLSDIGYEIRHRFGHDGVALNENGFRILFEHSKHFGSEYSASAICGFYNQESMRLLEGPNDGTITGARWPVVLAAVKRE